MLKISDLLKSNFHILHHGKFNKLDVWMLDLLKFHVLHLASGETRKVGCEKFRWKKKEF